MHIRELDPPRAEDSEQTYDDEEKPPKKQRPMGRPRKPDEQLKRPRPPPRREEVEKAKEELKRELRKELLLESRQEPKQEPIQEQKQEPKAESYEAYAQDTHAFIRQFGETHRMYQTQKQEKVRSLFRNHYP